MRIDIASAGSEPFSAAVMLRSAFSGLVVPMIAVLTSGKLRVNRSAISGQACSGSPVIPSSAGSSAMVFSRLVYGSA